MLALDRDAACLEATRGPGIAVMQFDLEDATLAWPFEPARFAAIVVTNYLHRPLMDSLLASLAPGGLLIYETFAKGNEAHGKPSNPLFLLDPGELLVHAGRAGLHVVAFEDGLVAAPALARVQRITALRPAVGADSVRLDLPAPGETGQE